MKDIIHIYTTISTFFAAWHIETVKFSPTQPDIPLDSTDYRHPHTKTEEMGRNLC